MGYLGRWASNFVGFDWGGWWGCERRVTGVKEAESAQLVDCERDQGDVLGLLGKAAGNMRYGNVEANGDSSSLGGSDQIDHNI
jgi:hypothetical protein